MFAIKKQNIKNYDDFNKDEWEIYAKSHRTDTKIASNTINLTYTYCNVLYYTITFEYIYDKKRIVGLSLSLPPCNANSDMESRILEIFSTTEDAIMYIENIKKDGIGKIAILTKKGNVE